MNQNYIDIDQAHKLGRGVWELCQMGKTEEPRSRVRIPKTGVSQSSQCDSDTRTALTTRRDR